MRIFKRAWISVIKRKSRTFLIFLVLICVASLVFSGLSISAATKESARLAKAKLGSTVTLSFNMQKAFEEARSATTTSSQSSDRRGMMSAVTTKPVTEDMVNKLSGLAHVTATNLISTGGVLSTQISYIKTEITASSQAETQNNRFQNSNGDGQTNFVQAEYSMQGLLYSEAGTDFMDKSSTLLSGRHITSSDKSTYVVMISDVLAEANSLSVGSKVTFTSRDSTVLKEFEVVGIYKTTNTPDVNSPESRPSDNPYNKIYVPYDIAGAMTPTTEGGGMGNIGTAVFYIDYPENIDVFKAEAAKTDIDWNTFTLSADETQYAAMTSSINKVASTSNILIILTSVAGAIILALILMLSLKERTTEVGVLLSLGERKSAVALQILVEVLMVAAVAFIFAIIIGYFVSGSLGNMLLKNEVAAAASQTANNFGGFPGGGGRGFTVANGIRGFGNSTNTQPITEINVSLNLSEILRLLWMGLVIIFASVILPLVTLMRKKPREILIKHE